MSTEPLYSSSTMDSKIGNWLSTFEILSKLATIKYKKSKKFHASTFDVNTTTFEKQALLYFKLF